MRVLRRSVAKADTSRDGQSFPAASDRQSQRRNRPKRGWTVVLLGIGLCAPVPAVAATGLALPLPSVVVKFAASLASAGGETVDVTDVDVPEYAAAGEIVLSEEEEKAVAEEARLATVTSIANKPEQAGPHARAARDEHKPRGKAKKPKHTASRPTPTAQGNDKPSTAGQENADAERTPVSDGADDAEASEPRQEQEKNSNSDKPDSSQDKSDSGKANADAAKPKAEAAKDKGETGAAAAPPAAPDAAAQAQEQAAAAAAAAQAAGPPATTPTEPPGGGNGNGSEGGGNGNENTGGGGGSGNGQGQGQ